MLIVCPIGRTLTVVPVAGIAEGRRRLAAQAKAAPGPYSKARLVIDWDALEFEIPGSTDVRRYHRDSRQDQDHRRGRPPVRAL